MHGGYDRFSKRSGLRWAIGLGLAAALALPASSATAQGEVQTSPSPATPANCAIQLSVANPNPGNQDIPRSLVMSGTALDGTAKSGTGISQVQAFLGNRDQGGTFLGKAAFGVPSETLPGAWSLTATIPPNVVGGQEMVVYGQSSVSGQEAMVSIPIVVGEAMTNPPIPSMAQSFCPTVMAPAAAATPAVAATPQPTAAATPAVAATPQPTAAATPAATPTPQPTTPATPAATPTPMPVVPVSPPVAAPVPAPAAVELSISSPAAPPLTFDTDTLTASAGSQITVAYTNNEVGVPHDWHVFNGPDSTAPSLAETQIITGPGTMDSVTFTAPTQAGNYFFWCDVHPTIMTGTLVLQ